MGRSFNSNPVNTPSHAILNLALLLNQSPQAAAPILIGSVLPDVPMFVLFVWGKLRRIPESTLWNETYWKPFWQNFTHGFHSIPIAAIATLIFHFNQWHWLELLALSTVLHSFGDFPVHNSDAHRHFLPFSQYRFISPISYWDRRCYGSIVSFIERLLVLFATVYLWNKINNSIGQIFLIAVNFIYLSGYFFRFFFRRCEPSINE